MTRFLPPAVLLLCGLTACMPRYVEGPPAVVTRADSVSETGRLAYTYVREVDHQARPGGTLPDSLDAAFRAAIRVPAADIWGREMRYRREGLRFEVRSGGPDGAFETADDVVAFGHLGRDVPCAIRDDRRTWTGNGFEPPCPADAHIVVRPRCPALAHASGREDAVARDAADSVRVTGLRLVRIARTLDGLGRDFGGLPLTLLPIPSRNAYHTLNPGDPWRRALRYVRDGDRYEVWSAGADGLFGTGDDIGVRGRLGDAVACEYLVGGVPYRCDEPPPECPAAVGDAHGTPAAIAAARGAPVGPCASSPAHRAAGSGDDTASGNDTRPVERERQR